ncbi:SDR family NAD(P)-dependent oxidoreductase [Azospirillum argentinense]|uniref:SDR family NAD(P)-dependent oxidoreductase n=1 Tax=Azospirillum argentinense TaxID=2970906 RepID=UPI003D81313F
MESRLDQHPAIRQSVVVAREQSGGAQLVAYCVLKEPGRSPAPTHAELARHLADWLPDYMVPALSEVLDALPLTANGKIDRKTLSQRVPNVRREERRAPATDIERTVQGLWRELLRLDTVGTTDGFFEVGGDSVSAVMLARRIAGTFGVDFRAADLFRHATIRGIGRFLAEKGWAEKGLAEKGLAESAPPTQAPIPAASTAAARPAPQRGDADDSLAIVGIACGLPGAKTPAEFWRNLRAGRNCATRLSREALREAGVPDHVIDDPNFVPVQYCMEGRDRFDAGFFNISAKNALFMDPQFRVLLQHAWQAIEDAGYVPEDIPDTAVFMSASNGFYKTLLHSSGAVEPGDTYASWIAGQGGTIPTMVSYQLGLTGPSLAVHTNCSSSLVGLYLAAQALKSGEARCALVGAATLFPIPGAGHLHLPGMNLSSDGLCRAFDADADGLAGGEGAAVVMVKRARDAIADGDHIYALVRSVAVNNDGADKAGFYAPSVRGQAEVIQKALDAAGVDPATIGYVEAHGTGTRLGDPVEVMALAEVYRRHTDRRQFCGIGSVKPNIGHLDSAAGLAGLVKVALCLKHGEIPPSINFTRPNPEIAFETSAFRVVDRLTPWPAADGPRRAGLSSFGIGGTNAHAILEEHRPAAPPAPPTAQGPADQLIVLSARTADRLKAGAARLLAFLATEPEAAAIGLRDLAFTLQRGRRAFAHRLALRAASVAELVSKLERYAAGATTFDGCWEGVAGTGGLGALIADEREDADALVAQWLARGRLDRVARAWVDGMAVDWTRLHAGTSPRRVSLPTYPFAEERHWIDGMPGAAAAPAVTTGGAPAPADAVWLAHPVWRPQPADRTAPAPAYDRRVVVLCGLPSGVGDGLAGRLPGCDVTLLQPPGAEVSDRFLAACVGLLDIVRPLVADTGRRTLLQLVHVDQCMHRLYAGLSGWLKSAQRENPRLTAQLIAVGPDETTLSLAEKIEENRGAAGLLDINYRTGSRTVADWAPLPPQAGLAAPPWKERGVYLITGGTGGLGLIFAGDIARRVTAPTLILIGRSLPTPARQADIAALRAAGATVDVRQLDIGRKADVDAQVADMVRRWGRIDGVLHATGVTRDNFLLKKTAGDVREVLGAKVGGLINLDHATRDLDLDFMVLFSSAAAVLGSAGQADYSAANGFLDVFARYRNEQVSLRRRHGHTLAIDWPLWRDGGMRPDAAAEQAMRDLGLAPLATADGLAAFSRALAAGHNQTLVLAGAPGAIARLMAPGSAPAATPAAPDGPPDGDAPDVGTLRRQTAGRLKRLLAETVRLPEDRIQSSEPLEGYGVDSIAVTQMNRKLGDVFGPISRTLLFQYPTLDALAGHLAANHAAACRRWTGQEAVAAPPPTPLPAPLPPPAETPARDTRDPIAVIGLSGRYPQADTLEAFWANLRDGRDCVGEIPADRWPLDGFFEPDAAKAVAEGKSYAKWGAFLDGFADFDPLFFNIAPREARAIDPQERLFLQCAWEALESAGYTRDALRDGAGRRVGVFAGVTKTGFDLYGPELRRRGQVVFPHTSFSSIANRVSYCLNLGGPSMPVDTMCSASLTAIHEACQHIRHGDCDMALAGGVNLYLHPSGYVGLCSAYMLSRDGRCRSFGRGANGFVPGEGVGVVLLKRLSQAVRDGDPIHGVILGTAVNHGGKTNGYTVPNPAAQAEVIRDCLRRAGVDARTVGYVEAHGTGTELGDPIEVTGLTEAFRHDTADAGFCVLGSVKSNIGHLEAAAGIAGLTKILLQMRHGQIAPSLHARETNPNIDFAATPFAVPQTLSPWTRQRHAVDGQVRDIPRRAGLSSFGAGGSNAHALIEEYIPPDAPAAPRRFAGDAGPAVILLSARTEERLRQVIANLHAFLAAADADGTPSLHDVAHTLQVGREAFEERLGFVVSSLEELRATLARLLDPAAPRDGLHRGRIRRNRDELLARAADPAFRAQADAWMADHRYEALLEEWTKGVPVDWSRLYPGEKPRRVPLPTYPFARQRIWWDTADTATAPAAAPAVAEAPAASRGEPAETILMRPVWDAVAPAERPFLPSGARVAIIGGSGAQKAALRDGLAAVDIDLAAGTEVADIAHRLRAAGPLDHIVWFAPAAPVRDAAGEAVLAAQDGGVVQVFRLIKALLAEGYGDRPFGLTGITTQTLAVSDGEPADAVHAAVHGLLGSLAREYPGWRVRALDVAAAARWPLPGLWSLPPQPQGESCAWRGREWLKQSLVALDPSRDAGADAAIGRRGGVYVVIGGAGGLGAIWSHAALRDHGARVVWLGRSPLDAAVQAKLDAAARHGAAPLYIQADARDDRAMADAAERIRRTVGAVNGIVVSTLGDYDKSLARMPEALFRDILSTKLDVAVRTARHFRNDPLDFVLFFSSMAAFARPGGMAAYAAASTACDALARRFARDGIVPARVINWGYWDVGGGARVTGAVKGLVGSRGVEPLDPAGGLDAIGRLLATPLAQLAATRTRQPEWIETYAPGDRTRCLPATGASFATALAAWRPEQAAPAPNPSTRLLEDWIARLLLVEMRQLGLLAADGPFDADALRRRSGILPKFERWWREALNILFDRGLLDRPGETPAIGPAGAALGRDAVWRQWREEKPRFLEEPETRTLAVLIDDCLTQLPDVLHGRTLVTDILFPNGAMDKIAGLYRNNRVCDYFNDVVAGVAVTYIRNRLREDPAARIRILEIGAGTGGTSTTVLAALEPWRHAVAEYCYTDLSQSFLRHARVRYGDRYPFLTYRIVNAEEPLEPQGIAIGGHDIVIATNVLHATRNMRITTRTVKTALRANGIAVLNEISDKTVFASALFGLIDGWSLAEDEHWRIPGSPGLYPDAWRDLLLQEGFRSVFHPAAADHGLGQQIIVAESDGVIRQSADAIRPAAPAAVPPPVSPAPVPAIPEPLVPTMNVPDADPTELVQTAILDSLADALGIGRDAIELDVPFSDYGVDSILGVGFIQQVNTALGVKLNTTVLFDHTTAARLTAHIVEAHPQAARALLPQPPSPKAMAAAVHSADRISEPPPAVAGRSGTQGIAVIGMSGQFPGAADVDGFWRNIIDGVDPIVDLPAHYLDPQNISTDKQSGKSYCRRGGVLETRDCFDPLFFSLSPREAVSMNPHQRLILLEAWRALEDAGCNPRSLAESRTGIYVGCEPSAYVHESFTGASDAIVASRLSYFLNLKGPALAVNTGCSSSAVALHLACESLRNGETDLVLSGGAFAVMGDTILVGLSQTDMLSHDGRCRAFDADADGMVMSEGVGMVAMKRLEDALADGDAIYGVIRASGFNQDGASNGITAPSGIAQRELIVDVYERFGIDPERITYVEAHGTGTKLGDPVEANALIQAFRHFTPKTGFCAIGSAKTHIGHTAGASGVAGLIHVLLCLKHGQVAPMRNFRRINPLIDFDNSAFRPNTGLPDWPRRDGRPRMAALSSFGHSGTNVHMVVEEFVGDDSAPRPAADEPELIVLSAKDEERLDEVAARLHAFVGRLLDSPAPVTPVTLADIAWTLQTGRAALEQRLAFVARDLPDLARTLDALRQAGGALPRVAAGRVEPRRNGRPRPAAGDAGLSAQVPQWLANRDLDALADGWTRGAEIDWNRLPRAARPRRCHLPVYPFARERYWKPAAPLPRFGSAALHPLVHRNDSTLARVEFRTTLTGAEFFLADHVVQGRRLLPGVAYLEMAQAAVRFAMGDAAPRHPRRLSNIVWTAPIGVADTPVDLAIAIDRASGDGLAYRVTSRSSDGETRLHHQGVAGGAPVSEEGWIDLAALRAELAGAALPAEACYAALQAAGVVHGPTLRVIGSLHATGDRVLAELTLPPSLADTANAYDLHPALLDGALQASVALGLAGGGDGGGARPALVPFTLDALDILGPCQATMWAAIRMAPGPSAAGVQKLDIDLCTGTGEVRVRLRGFASRAAAPKPSAAPSEAPVEVVTEYSGAEPFLRDHSAMMPATVYLDLARVAAARAGIRIAGLSNVVWPHPFFVRTAGDALVTRMEPAGDAATFAIAARAPADGGDRPAVHCQGRVIVGPAGGDAHDADLDSIRDRCTARLTREDCDRIMRGTHGPSLLCITRLDHNDREALARVALPVGLHLDGSDDTLHPSLLNGAILTAVIWCLTRRPGADLPMPFSLDRLRLHRPLPTSLHVHVRSADPAGGTPQGLETLDITLHDGGGRPVASLERFTLRFAAPPARLVLAAPDWTERPVPAAPVPVPGASPAFVLAPGQTAVHTALRSRWPDSDILVLDDDDGAAGIERSFHRTLELCRRLLKRPGGGGQPLILLVPDDDRAWRHAGLAGLIKTARLEQPRLLALAVRHAATDAPGAARLVECMAAEIAADTGDVEIRYDAAGRRHVRTLAEVSPSETGTGAFRRGDVVWITGGLGGIGKAAARHLAVTRGARVVLTGRSALDAAGQAYIDDLRRQGGDIVHLAADIADPAATAEAVRRIRETHGRLDGVLHGAGVIRDDYIVNKSAEQAADVLRPKVAGALALDAATAGLPLRHFVLFSSIAGALGNPGQADYAAANAFLDAFAGHRDERVRRGERSGRTVSINWPLWRDGGMRMGAANEALMAQATGMVAMDSADGLRALEQALAEERTRLLVAFGDADRIRGGLLAFRHPAARTEPGNDRNGDGAGDGRASPDRLRQAVAAELVRIVSEVQRIPATKIALHRDLSDYGFDSITFTELANALNTAYGLMLMPTLFFEIPDLAALADHLIDHHRPALLKRHGAAIDPPPVRTMAEAMGAPAVTVPVARPAVPDGPAARESAPAAEDDADDAAVAIIGVGAKLPGAADLAEFWDHLENNRDLITEVPADRWDWRAVYGDPHREPGKTRVKWGGFLADADRFDARFFNIAPAEAEVMDPQFRLFLETVWAAIEDAGYPAGRLAGSRTGVFAGVATADYKDLLAEARRQGAVRSAAEPFPFMVANRVSFWFDLNGPSEVIDTACSSSLIAIHRAVESLRQGGCTMALAGGVNVIAGPRLTIASSQAGLLSEDGRCMTFDQRANGYVRSEGVAVLLLKPLARAIADGDRIQGVIRASGENHGGRSASPTAPNGAAQRKLLVDVHGRAGIDPRSVTYIEAHGTGTALGDPVEVNALKGAFADLYQRAGLDAPAKPHCGLASVKANIGHLEAAAGAAGIVKVLLMLKHRKIPGNPQLRTPNPYLTLDGTPLYLVGGTRPWDPAVGPDGTPLPLRAGVSSFGVGGSNAHVIIEEHRPAAATAAAGGDASPSGPALIVLSARDADRLRDAAARLRAFLSADGGALRLHDVAHTLQSGREAMAHRLAFAAATVAEVVDRLGAFLDGVAPLPGLHSGQIPEQNGGLVPFADDDDMAVTVDAWIAKGKHDRLLSAWVNGLAVDWSRLYGDQRPRRVGLPTYPFARDRFWVSAATTPAAAEPAADAVLAFEESWAETPLDATPGHALRTLVCLLSDPAHQRAAREAFAARDPAVRVAFVDRETAVDRDACAKALSAIKAEAGGIDAVLYLWPLEDRRLIADSTPILFLIQAMAAAGVEPARLVLSGAHTNDVERCHLDSWVAFDRSLRMALPRTRVAVVFRDGAAAGAPEPMRPWLGRLWDELRAPRLQSAWYRAGIRHTPAIRPADLPERGESLLRQRGTYLITGGCGGLGLIFAEHLAGRYGANLLLTGRAPLDGGRRAALRTLQELGGQALYLQADATDAAAMADAVRQARARWGRIDGVLHVAGISGAAPLLQADPAGFTRVLGPKVAGTLALHGLFGDDPPDFIAHVSSSSAVLGDFGSCDYALANRFQTAFAAGQSAGECRTFAVNWPFWQDGGGRIGDDDQTRFYLRSTGQRPLRSAEALALFERALASGKPQILLLAGDPARLGTLAAAAVAAPEPATATARPAAVPAAAPARRDGDALDQSVLRDVKAQICDLLKARPQDVGNHKNLADFGFDSISLMEFARVLNRLYGLELSPSVFFSHATPQRLAAHLIRDHRAAMEAFYADADADADTDREPEPPPIPATVTAQTDGPEPAPEPIAIIGMSGRFPKARNVDELWSILDQGIDAVEEIPPDRFDWRRFYAGRNAGPGASNSKWCGCVPGIAEFDSLFFEISPLEAERMDPRQRHLLQESWLALEDAGYGPAQIGRQRIGMFVGVEEGCDYQRRLTQVSLTASHTGILAARLAYFLNLKGPVLAVNTACSSALVAAHLACRNLLDGECDTAIAAGVNLLVSPEAYVGMTQAGMLSPDGKCRAFDHRANGLVPGEAVAVVVLKRLSRALADGDPIHAVIRGSGVNYDGRTNGITAPSGEAQTELVRDVVRRSSVAIDDIDCIVAHGTATQLGDPVEVNALNDAFRGATDRRAFCALTSTKSNLGHTFAASGLVSLIGLVQAIRNRVIPPTLHCEKENAFGAWRDSPFFVNKARRPWEKPAGRERVGAVSAFGMSGTNAHMLVAEHTFPAAAPPAAPPFHVLTLSAKTKDALREQRERMAAHLRTTGDGIDAIAYTLLQGRHHFEHRTAIVVADLREAAEAWSGTAPPAHRSDGFAPHDATGDGETRDTIARLVRQAVEQRGRPAEYRETLAALARFHCEGHDVPWGDLYSPAPRRVGLPGYPFARERHWIDEPALTEPVPPKTTRAAEPAALALTVPDRVHDAARRQTGGPVMALRNLVWGKPAGGEGAGKGDVAVTFHRQAGALLFSAAVTSGDATAGDVVACGEVVHGEAGGPLPPDVAVARLRAGLKPLGHGSDARITAVYGNATQRLATVALPDGEAGSRPFHPLLLEAVRRLIGTFDQGADQEAGRVWLPSSLRRIVAAGPLPQEVALHLVRTAVRDGVWTFDATAYHAAGHTAGRACLHLQDFASTADPRLLEGRFRHEPGGDDHTTVESRSKELCHA